MVFPADDATCRRALLVGNLHPAVNTDQARGAGFLRLSEHNLGLKWPNMWRLRGALGRVR